MTGDTGLVINTAELFGKDSRVSWRTEATLDELQLVDSGLRSMVVDGALSVRLVLEQTGSEGRSLSHGAVLVRGTATGRWSVSCRRCLEPMQGALRAEIDELFEVNPTEGETWLLRDDCIDLTPMLREAALLALPLAPLCNAHCQGPAPDRFPTGAAEDQTANFDPRWAALTELTFDA